MRYLLTLLVLLSSLHAVAADYSRERKWADEVLPSVLVGDPVWLEQANGHKFLGLYTPAAPSRAGVVVVHGIGVHPDWGMISTLRQQLPEAGYATLSIQMPVLKADAKTDDYPPTFDEAAEHLQRAVEFLRAKGHAKVAIVAHSLGSRMSYHYLSRHPDAPVGAWIAIGTSGAPDMARLKLPVFDLYGQNDLPQVIDGAAKRAAGLKQKGSAQTAVPGADHFFEGKDAALLEQVRGWLDKAF
jgi:pimeloyl-ACP methyl ester carboxylesterase